VLSPSPTVFFNYCLITPNSAAEATELVNIDTPSHALHMSGIVHTRVEVCRIDLEMSGLVK